MLLTDPKSLQPKHRLWFRVAAFVAVVATAGYAAEAVLLGRLPGGSSASGLTAGVVAGLLMLYLAAYGLRKLAPLRWVFRLWPTKYWLVQHVWLGVLTFPLVALHARLFTSGGLLPWALLVVYFGVFLSGVWGLYWQYRAPRLMLEDVPDETIQAQVPALLAQLKSEADLVVMATCGPGAYKPEEWLATLERSRDLLEDVRAGKGTGLLRVLPPTPVPGSEPLRAAFAEQIAPYLDPVSGPRTSFRLRARREQVFADLRGRLRVEAHPVVAALEDLCERRAQLHQQAQLHGWLHAWVGVHLCLTGVLVVLLSWHVVTSFLYW